MNRLAISAGVAVAALLASSAQATTYLEATFASPDGSASWDQDFAPTPLAYANGVYTAVGVWNYTDTLGGMDPYVFYFSTAESGGWQDAAGDFAPTGAQVYGGSEAAPVFSAGSYAEGDGTLTLTAAPEPSAWAMMLVGFGLVAAARRRRVAIA
jgi:PEP-CTERM motif